VRSKPRWRRPPQSRPPPPRRCCAATCARPTSSICSAISPAPTSSPSRSSPTPATAAPDDHRRAGAASAVRVRARASRTRRRLPQRHPQPAAAGEPRGDQRRRARARADFGIAWDGDFDRCFLFDERGAFIEGYYIVGLLAEALLAREPGARIIHDPRLTWNTIDVVTAAGGIPVQSKTGHAFIKERMRAENAVYGGEMSAHHYFRDFAFADNGNIPWLLVAALLSQSGQPLSALVAERQRAFPASGEINRRVGDIDAVLARIEAAYAPQALRVEKVDGLSVEYPDWRFNLRGSNTEPVLRLNVEARGDAGLMRARTDELLARIDAG
jgi:phosphomannomutase (EC 5.4.2.8)